MQDHYVSLNPDEVYWQSINDRRMLFNQRSNEAYGGQAADMMGNIFGLTAAQYMYVKL